MFKHTATFNTSLTYPYDIEGPEKSSYSDGQDSQLSTSALIPPRESSKSFTFNSSAISNDPSFSSYVPSELLIQIFKNITATQDLLHCTRVSRMWCECAIKLLWQDISHFDGNVMSKIGRVLAAPRQTFTYARFIRCLEIDPSTFNVEVLLQFIHCDNIEHLKLAGCQYIPEEILIRVFARFRNLTTINLADCFQITNDFLIHLAHTTKRLENINLGYCSRLTDEGIIALARGCPSLSCINVNFISSITDSAVTTLAKSCPLLTKIDLSHCSLVTDLGVRSLWQYSLHIQEIYLPFCGALTSKAFPALPSSGGQQGRSDIYPSLSASLPGFNIDTGDLPPPLTLNRAFDHNRLLLLELSRCSLITDDTIERVISHAPNIQCLRLSGCRQLTGRTIETICKLGESLQHLDLGRSNKLGDSSIRLLARSCTKLQSLHFGICAQSTLATVRFLLQKLEDLDILQMPGFSPFQDPGLQKSYGNAFGPDAGRMGNAESRLSNGIFVGSEILKLRNFLAEL